MKIIQLSNSPLVAMVDDEDFERLSILKWKLHQSGGNKQPYVVSKCCIKGDYFLVFLQHAIIGQPIVGLTDHKDRNTFNNQKANLRHCTYRQNAQNCSARRDGLKGVYFNRRSRANPWVAQIVVDGRKIWLGSFPTEVQGHQAYCHAATKHFGEFACHG